MYVIFVTQGATASNGTMKKIFLVEMQVIVLSVI